MGYLYLFYMACVVQAFAVVRFLFHYAMPVGVFAFCYARIFHTIRRQSKVMVSAGHVAVATAASRDQVQQQVLPPGGSLSRTELNILKTMVTIFAARDPWQVAHTQTCLDHRAVRSDTAMPCGWEGNRRSVWSRLSRCSLSAGVRRPAPTYSTLSTSVVLTFYYRATLRQR